MSDIETQARILIARFEKLLWRERALVLLLLLVIVVVAWNALFFSPRQTRRKHQLSQLQAENGKLANLNIQAATILAGLQNDPNAKNKIVLQRLREEQARLDTKLADMTAGLISPSDMTAVLRNLLSRQSGLKLVKLKNLPPVSLLPEPPEKEGSDSANRQDVPNAYQHDLLLEFEGSFAQTLGYLKSIERLSGRLFWDHFELKVLKYPTADITIQVHTVSLQKGLIGV